MWSEKSIIKQKVISHTLRKWLALSGTAQVTGEDGERAMIIRVNTEDAAPRM